MKYKNIENASRNAKNNITLSDIIKGKFHHINKGYINLKIDNIDLDGLVSNILSGSCIDYKSLIEYYIEHKICYIIFGRIIYYKNHWQYIGNEDYGAEIEEIRKLLRGIKIEKIGFKNLV